MIFRTEISLRGGNREGDREVEEEEGRGGEFAILPPLPQLPGYATVFEKLLILEAGKVGMDDR